MPRTNSAVLVDMFGPDLTDAEYGKELDLYKSAMAESVRASHAGEVFIDRDAKEIGERTIQKRAKRPAYADKLVDIEKSLDADSPFAAEFAEIIGDIQKDWTPTNPLNTPQGLTPYDLEGPAKVMVPLSTPLRNSITRVKGQGNAREYRRIDSFSNAGVPGGAGNLTPFFSSLTTTSTWGPTGNLTLARPQKIQYTASKISVPYVELGYSDSVDYLSYFEALGFDNLRSLSNTALLYSHMMGEERAILYARGSATGYSGAISAPTVTVAGATTGGALPDATYFCYVAAVGGFGQSAVSAVQSSGALAGGGVNKVTVTVATEPVGGLYYNLYVGTVTGIANAKFQGSFVGNSFVLTTFNAAGAVIAGTDNSADANAYDGLLTIQSGPTSGYFKRINAQLSTTNPGTEWDTAMQVMFVNNGATPSEIWTTGSIRKQMAQLMRIGGANGASSGYRTELRAGDNGVVMGTSVTGIVNSNTGTMVDVRTHRFMPIGCLLLRSTTLPLQDSHIPAPVAAINVQDYMAIKWPDIQLTTDTSTYQIGTLAHYAPQWSGLLVGIQDPSGQN